MNKGINSSLEVKEFYKKTREFLKLRPALGRVGFSRKITRLSSKNRLSSIQVWGKKEIQSFERLSSEKRKEFLKNKMNDDVACLILVNGLNFLPEILEEAIRKRLAMFSSGLAEKKCKEGVKGFLSLLSAEEVMISGGLLQIFGLGVLIIGDSGVGKSESSLELISRGSRFISDDVSQIVKTAEGKLIGKAPPLSRNFMEIRGLGIINIKEIFGLKAICPYAEISLVIELKRWEEGKEYDRLGLKFPADYEILGKKIPKISIPVAPGRNIATLIEIACRVLLLREKGYHAPSEIIKKLDRVLSLR